MLDKIASKTLTGQFINPHNQPIEPLQRAILAIKNDRCDILVSIFNSKEELMQKDQFGKGLLSYAVFYKSQECLLYLLRSGLPYQQLDKDNKNIYHYIGYCGSVECLQMLNFHIKLTRLIKLNDDLIRILSKHGYKRTDMRAGKLKYTVSPKRQKHFSQLQTQAIEKYKQYHNSYIEQLFKCLVEKDTENQRNPIHLVCLNKYQKCLPTLQQLISQLINPNIKLNNKLLYITQKINIYYKQKIDPRLYQETLECLGQILSNQIKCQIQKNYDKLAKNIIKQLLETKDKQSLTSLHIASKNGTTSMINLIQKHISNIKISQKQQIMKIANNNINRSHIIDLCEASKLSDIKPLNFLISCGEAVNQKKTIFGIFPLIQAIKSYQKQHSVQSIKTLIKSGADVNIQDTNGWTVLHHAASLGLKNIIQLLLNTSQQTKININKVTNKRYHALHLAAMQNHSDVVIQLIQNTKTKVNIDVPDWDGCTALMHAAKKGSIKVLKTLLQLKANIYAQDARDMTALHHASFSFHPQCIRQLLNYDSDYDKLRDMRNSKGKLARDLCTDSKAFQNIFTAARTGNVNLIRKLIADSPTLKDTVTLQKERTPLILAVLAKSLVSVKFLVDSGADTYHEDKQGKSVIVYCDQLLNEARVRKNQTDIITLEQIKRLLG